MYACNKEKDRKKLLEEVPWCEKREREVVVVVVVKWFEEMVRIKEKSDNIVVSPTRLSVRLLLHKCKMLIAAADAICRTC